MALRDILTRLTIRRKFLFAMQATPQQGLQEMTYIFRGEHDALATSVVTSRSRRALTTSFCVAGAIFGEAPSNVILRGGENFEHSTLYTSQFTPGTPHSTLLYLTDYTLHYTLYTYAPHSTLYTPHCTLYTP